MAPVYIWPLMAAGYTALLYCLVRANGTGQAFAFTWVFFFGYFSASLYWISHALFVDIALWWWALPLSFIGLPVLLSLFPAVLAGLAARIRHFAGPNAILSAILFSIALILADIARSTLLTGFPWNLPVHAWAKTPYVTNVLPYLGLFGLNALMVVLLSVPAFAIAAWMEKRRVFAFLIILTAIASIMASRHVPPPHNQSVQNNALETIESNYRLRLIQANIPQKVKWDPAYVWRNFETYLAMTADSLDKGRADKPALIIWPETALSANFLSYPQAGAVFHDFLASLPPESILVSGLLNSDYRQTPPKHYNSIAFFDRSGNVIAKYDKHHLVPFGEYIPYQSLVPIGPISGFEGFEAGTPPAPIRIGNTELPDILPLICYEIIFSSYAQSATLNGVIINITNDAWFGKTAGAYQHFDHAVLRAVENRMPVIRMSGNGISAIIHPDGSIGQSTLLNVPAVIYN